MLTCAPECITCEIRAETQEHEEFIWVKNYLARGPTYGHIRDEGLIQRGESRGHTYLDKMSSFVRSLCAHRVDSDLVKKVV